MSRDLGWLKSELSRILAAANGRRRARTLGLPDARYMVELLSFRILDAIRRGIASGLAKYELPPPPSGLDIGKTDDAPFAVVIDADQSFRTASLAGDYAHGWAYPDAWKFGQPKARRSGSPLEGWEPSRSGPYFTETRAMVVRDGETVTFGATQTNAGRDTFFAWPEVGGLVSGLMRVRNPEVYDAGDGDEGREEAPYVDPSKARISRAVGKRVDELARSIDSGAAKLDAIRWILVNWARRPSADRVSFPLELAADFVASAPKGNPGDDL